LIRIFGSTNFSIDDTETVVHTQVLQPYYALRNPPLFDWLFFALSRVLGVSNPTFQVLKVAMVFAAACFLYAAARPAFRYRGALEASFAGYGITAFFGWDMYQQFTHGIALIFSMAFALWAVMRVVRSGRTPDFLILGLALGLGILSKYLFLLYFAALIVSACLRPAHRRHLLSWRLGLSLVVALVAISPLVIGLAIHTDAIMAYLDRRMVGSAEVGVIQSLGITLLLSGEFWLPLSIFIFLSLRQWPAAASAPAIPDRPGDPDFYPFVRDATLMLAGAVLFSVIVMHTSIPIHGGRYLLPELSLLPLVIFARIDRIRPFPGLAMQRFRQGALILVAIIALGRFLIFLFVSPPFCVPRCTIFVDFRPVAERIAALAGDKQPVILSDDVHTGSNLLRLVPNARVVMDYYTAGSDLPLAPPADRRCFFVWETRERGGETESLQEALQESLRRKPTAAELATFAPAEEVTAGWQTKLLAAHDPASVYAIAGLDSASPLCDGHRQPGLSAPPSTDSMQ